ncbi:MAG: SDR family oxidoreductase [Candidatus Theseobacter exili]|nr:SDR family oxidoreductase [Candidatus Theseobacter exili]
MGSKKHKDFTKTEIDNCISTLTYLVDNCEVFAAFPEEKQIELMKIAGQLSRPDREQKKERKKAIRKKNRQQIVTSERKARASTGIRSARESAVFTAPLQISDIPDHSKELLKLQSPRNCYVCKAEFKKLHFFYDTMCPGCAELNYQKRFQKADLTGQVAFITGSRLKIGYQSALMMLRAGAEVIATTRFPVDSAARYSKEKDFKEWGDRLHIYGLDLRHTPSVEIFCAHIEQTFDRLDILINNAAQTVRRPPGFYAHLMDNENRPLHELPKNVQKLMKNYQICTDKLNSFAISGQQLESAVPVSWHGTLPGIGLRESARLSQIPYAYDNTISAATVFPKGRTGR